MKSTSDDILTATPLNMQFATAPNRSTGKSELFLISLNGHVYRIYQDSNSDSGWRMVDMDFPENAQYVAAAGNQNGKITVYASDTNNHVYHNRNFTNLVTGIGNSNNLQVLGIGEDGFAYLIAYQEAQGKNPGRWFDGFILPYQDAKMAAITTINGGPKNGGPNLLEVIGLGQDGKAYVVGWQTTEGTWNGGLRLPFEGKWKQLVTAHGNNNNVQIIGLGEDGFAYLAAWQQADGPTIGTWSEGFILPGQSVKLTALTTGIGDGDQLQVIGLGEDGHAYLVAWQNQAGKWFGGLKLPSNGQWADLITDNGNGNNLQVFGIGQDGFVYLVAYQEAQGKNSGKWFDGFILPDQRVKMTAITTGKAPDNSLEVFGLGHDSQAYLVAQQNKQGIWHGGRKLPGQNANLTAIATGRGNSNFLQVIGVNQVGQVNLIAWQNEKLDWVAGRNLASGWQRLPDPIGAITGIRVGYDKDNTPFVTLAFRNSGYLNFATLMENGWSSFGLQTLSIYGWSPALVPFSTSDRNTNCGVYASLDSIRTVGDRGVLGEVLFSEYGEYIIGRYSTVTATNSALDYSSVFALSEDDHRIYYLSPSNSPDRLLSKVKISHGIGVVDMAAGSNATGLLEVFAIGSNRLLYHVSQEPTNPSGWTAFLNLNPNLAFAQLVVGKNPAGYSDVFAVTTTGEFYHIWQDPLSHKWNFDHIETRLQWFRDLVAKVAPIVYLHPDELYLPSSFESYVKATTYVDPNGKNQGQLTPAIVKTPPHGKDGYLTYPWNDQSIRAGDVNSAVCYTHVTARSDGLAGYDVQYWFFSPFNGPGIVGLSITTLGVDWDGTFEIAPLGEHEGDLEHVSVRVDASVNIQSMYYSQHGGGTWYKQASKPGAHDGYTLEKGHPVVYSALNGHPSYPWVGEFPTLDNGTPVGFSFDKDSVRIAGGLLNITRDGGKRWDCSLASNHLLVAVDTPEFKYSSNTWWFPFLGRIGLLNPSIGDREKEAVDRVYNYLRSVKVLGFLLAPVLSAIALAVIQALVVAAPFLDNLQGPEGLASKDEWVKTPNMLSENTAAMAVSDPVEIAASAEDSAAATN
jgi:hypothetical protein